MSTLEAPIPAGETPSRLKRDARRVNRKKKCPKCGTKYDLTIENFPYHSTSTDGFASYCRPCRNNMRKKRSDNSRCRIKHHIATRVAATTPNLPKEYTRNLEKYLGYGMTALRDHLEADLQRRMGIGLKEAFKLGYHIDHMRPLSSFPITSIDCSAFKDCWRIENLQMLSATENLQKGAKILSNE